MSGTLLLTQSDLQQCGATDLDLVGTALEEMFRIHARGEFTAPPSNFLKRPECPHVADRIIGLSAHLGGRFEPVGDSFEGSSIQVLEGAEGVPGLVEALD